MHIIALILVLLTMGGATNAPGGELQPFLEHAHGRAPHEAWQTLQHTPYAQAFTESLAHHQGWTRAHASEVLAAKSYSTCSYQGWFWSDGLRFADGSWSVGAIYREAYPNERFACVQGRPIFSGTCGNAVRAIGGKPDVVCRDIGHEHGSITVGGAGAGMGNILVGGTTTTTTFDSNLFECQFTTGGKK